MSTEPHQADYTDHDEARYRAVFDSRGRSATLREIWRRAYEDDYPEEADPFGFVTRHDLAQIARRVRLSPGQTLLDMGCGKGGPGLWVARQTGARLIGLDIVASAVEQAVSRARRFELASTPRFLVGSYTAIGLETGIVDGVMGVDSFWMVVDKAAAVIEMARVTRPLGRLVLTTWAPRHLRSSPLWAAGGFRILSWEETPYWRERQLCVYRGILERREAIAAELGEAATSILVFEAEKAPSLLREAPRVMIVAERRDCGESECDEPENGEREEWVI